MLQRFMFIVFGTLIFSIHSNAQTIQEKIDQHAKDPKTKENAAKADVYIADQKALADSNQVKSSPYKSCKARKARKAECRRAPKNHQ